MLHTAGTSNSNGLIILINKKFSHDLHQVIYVNKRCMGIHFTYNNQKFVILNIYAPATTEDRINFIKEIPNLNQYCPPDSILMVMGDFNMVLDNELDIISGEPHSKNEIIAFNIF